MHLPNYIISFLIVFEVQSVYLKRNKALQKEVAERKNKIKNPKAATHTSDTTDIARGYSETEPCALHVLKESETLFTYNILTNRYNFVYMKLNFVNFIVNETETVISKNDWVWTYKGENGAHQYLYLPGEFGYLSFGLLWSHTMAEKIPINIKKSGNCNNMKIGVNETDLLIGQALGNMTSKSALHHGSYNSSYWCYFERFWMHSQSVYEACANSICTFQTIKYKCCKFHHDYTKNTQTVICDNENYVYGALWWMLPIIFGNFCWAFYPLLLTKIGIKIKSMSKRIEKERNLSSSMEIITGKKFNQKDVERKTKYLYFSLKGPNPITVFSTLCWPFLGWNLSGPIMSRVLRIWIIILPIALSMFRVIIDFKYAKDVLTEAVHKGALIGFSSLLAGPEEARKHFLYIFGGPIVAVAIFFSFGSLLMVFPTNLEDFVSAGIPSSNKKLFVLVKMPLKLKEKMSGINVRHHKGFKELHKLFLAQIFMLLHFRFWGHAIKLFYLRWNNIIFSTLTQKLHNMFVFVLCITILPLYIIFCLIELIFAVLYYAFPVINCFFIVLKSFLLHYTAIFQHRGYVMKFIKYFFFLPILILFCISWYMYCIIFFDGFWFLSKIVMFTYSGIIAYPKLSYGYLVLVFMAIYYLTESLNAFGANYRELLKLSLEVCEKLQQEQIEDSETNQDDVKNVLTKYGIKADLFYTIVDRHLPRRNQILVTIVKLAAIITVLTISVELLITFDKFQELSVLTHVFTVLFICALPKIISKMCLQNLRSKFRRKMRAKILRSVSDYIQKRSRNYSGSDNDESHALLSRVSGYETFRDMDSDD